MLKEKKKKRSTGRCTSQETSPSLFRQYLYSYISVHERVIMKNWFRVIMKNWFIRMPDLNVSAVVLSKRLYLYKTIKSFFSHNAIPRDITSQ